MYNFQLRFDQRFIRRTIVKKCCLILYNGNEWKLNKSISLFEPSVSAEIFISAVSSSSSSFILLLVVVVVKALTHLDAEDISSAVIVVAVSVVEISCWFHFQNRKISFESILVINRKRFGNTVTGQGSTHGRIELATLSERSGHGQSQNGQQQ